MAKLRIIFDTLVIQVNYRTKNHIISSCILLERLVYLCILTLVTFVRIFLFFYNIADVYISNFFMPSVTFEILLNFSQFPCILRIWLLHNCDHRIISYQPERWIKKKKHMHLYHKMYRKSWSKMPQHLRLYLSSNILKK